MFCKNIRKNQFMYNNLTLLNVEFNKKKMVLKYLFLIVNIDGERNIFFKKK